MNKSQSNMHDETGSAPPISQNLNFSPSPSKQVKLITNPQQRSTNAIGVSMLTGAKDQTINQGRTSQQLRNQLEDSRKKNLVNLSQHIISPSNSSHHPSSKAADIMKPPLRPPSNPSNMNSALPPKPEQKSGSNFRRNNSSYIEQ